MKIEVPNLTMQDYIAVMAMPVVAEHMQDEVELMQCEIAHMADKKNNPSFMADLRMQAIALLAYDMAEMMIEAKRLRNMREVI